MRQYVNARDQTPMMAGPAVRVADEVRAALDAGRPVVALESTLIAHGLPWPVNVEAARDAEAAVRDAGATPATIAVLGGVPRVGLDADALGYLATAGPGVIAKASRRDLGAVVAAGRDAATTVSATLRLARLAGIAVMATGGLGGVHRGAAETFDISADLDELARADGALVVCSGVKAILDVPATMERLESLGVPVVGYGTSRLPGFTVRALDWELEHVADDPDAAAGIVAAHRALGLPGAVVLARPVPGDAALDPEAFRHALDAALAAADARGIRGKPVTPFLLDAIRERTAGASLVANRALIVANAALAGAVAAALAARRGA
jgi:pseudouridine-5'-phosphate glycosidase